MGQTLQVIQGTRPPTTRASAMRRFRRAAAAVGISALVAIGVAAPLALRVAGDNADTTTTTTTAATTTTTTTSTTTSSTSTSVPVQVLGSTTIREGD